MISFLEQVKCIEPLIESDFGDNLIQIIGDLSQDDVFNKYKSILDEADIIFMDAPKDDKFEYAMAYKLNKLNTKKKILDFR